MNGVGVVELCDKELRIQINTKMIDMVMENIDQNPNDNIIFYLIISGWTHTKAT